MWPRATAAIFPRRASEPSGPKLIVAFAGLPSAGKSTIVNALAEKRVLECRTTTEVCLVGATNTVGAQKWVRSTLVSDDGVEFCAVDLPGTCDAEDKKGTFNKVTREWATKCDVLVWVTDVRTAFLTTHEAAQYAALRAAIQEKADEDGTLYQFLIVIAKFDASIDMKSNTNANANVRFLEDEIRTGSEETTIDGSFARVERTFPETRVVKFSAFARIAKSGSEALRALVSARSESTGGTNAAFDLRWATENLVEKRLAQMTRVLRSTRQRAVAAERRAVFTEKTLGVVKTRLDEADARALCALRRIEQLEDRIGNTELLASTVQKKAALGASYDTHVVLEFREGVAVEGTSYYKPVFKLGRSLPSLRVSVDRACSEAWLPRLERAMQNHTRQYEKLPEGQVPRWSRGLRYALSSLSIQLLDEHGSDGCGDVRQIAAPVVKPVYGDVYVDPACVSARGQHLSYECGSLCIYIGTADTGPSCNYRYVLKVGEVHREDLVALVRAITRPSDLTKTIEHSPLRLVAVRR